jgi:hypothetical protein
LERGLKEDVKPLIGKRKVERANGGVEISFSALSGCCRVSVSRCVMSVDGGEKCTFGNLLRVESCVSVNVVARW